MTRLRLIRSSEWQPSTPDLDQWKHVDLGGAIGMAELITPQVELITHMDRSRSVTFYGTHAVGLRAHSALTVQTTRSTELQAAHPSRITWSDPLPVGTVDELGSITVADCTIGLNLTYDGGDLLYIRFLGHSADNPIHDDPDIRSAEVMLIVPSLPASKRRSLVVVPTYSVEGDQDAILNISSAGSRAAADGTLVRAQIETRTVDGDLVHSFEAQAAHIGRRQEWEWLLDPTAIEVPHDPTARHLVELRYFQNNGTPIGTGPVPAAARLADAGNVIHRPHWPRVARH